MQTALLFVGLWVLISIPMGLVIGGMIHDGDPYNVWGRDDERAAALDAAWDEWHRYLVTGDDVYLQSAESLFFLAGFDLPLEAGDGTR